MQWTGGYGWREWKRRLFAGGIILRPAPPVKENPDEKQTPLRATRCGVRRALCVALAGRGHGRSENESSAVRRDAEGRRVSAADAHALGGQTPGAEEGAADDRSDLWLSPFRWQVLPDCAGRAAGEGREAVRRRQRQRRPHRRPRHHLEEADVRYPRRQEIDPVHGVVSGTAPDGQEADPGFAWRIP